MVPDRRDDGTYPRRCPEHRLHPAFWMPAEPHRRKGVIKEVRREHPEANIVAIDYDPGASEVNQLNRIKLMLSTAQKNLHKDDKKDA